MFQYNNIFIVDRQLDMCWNPEVSMATFLFSTISVLLAFRFGLINIYFLLFLMSFISMQLIEFFLWTYMKNPSLNRLFSGIGLATILLQPIFLILTAPTTHPLRIPLIGAYIVGVIALLALYRFDLSTGVGTNGHLEWKWLRMPAIALLAWFAFFFAGPIMSGNHLFTALIAITVAYSYYNYAAAGTWGSMWCYIANGVSIFYLAKLMYLGINTQ